MAPLLIPLGVVGSSKLPLSPYWIAIYGSETNVSNPYGYEAPQGMSVDQSGNSYIAGYGYLLELLQQQRAIFLGQRQTALKIYIYTVGLVAELGLRQLFGIIILLQS